MVKETIVGNDSFTKEPLSVREYKVNSANEFVDVLGELTLEAQEGLRPLLHVECHGDSVEGLEFLNSSTLEWETLAEHLTMLNAATEFNLIAVLSACFGAHYLRSIGVIKPASCAFVLAPTDEIDPGELLNGFRAFYNNLFDTLNLLEAAKAAYAQKLQYGTWYAEFAAAWYLKVVTGYVETNCDKKASRERLQSLHARLKADGVTKHNSANSIRELKRNLKRSNRERLIGDFFDVYFMIDRVPANRMKYAIVKHEIARRLDEMRATGRYLL